MSTSLGHGITQLYAPKESPMQPYWIDPHFFNQPPRRFRKIHLDFHNSQHIHRIGERFDADEFGDTLLAGNVDAVVVFAKDMHGYFYPSEKRTNPPRLRF
jgi:hypothetical protein